MSKTLARTSRCLDRLLAMERELRHLEGFDGWVIGSCSFTVSTAVTSSMVPETRTQLSLLRKSENRALIQIQTRDVSSNEQTRKASTNDQTCEALTDVPSADAADQMRVLLLRPTAPILAKANTEPDHAISNWGGSMDEPPRCASVNIPPERRRDHPDSLCFSIEEIDRYLDLVSDYNSIHRGPDAIVPGFLMVNRLLEIFLEVETPPRCNEANIPPKGRGCHPARAGRAGHSENASRWSGSVETPPRCNEAAGRAGHSENASRWSGSDEEAPELIRANAKFPMPLKAGEPVFLFRTPDCMEKTCFQLRNRAGQVILNMEFF